MSDTEQEPSMEEILASIRRIISDDDKEIEAAAQENEEVPEGKEELLGEETVAMAEPEPEPDPEPVPEPAAEEVDDDDGHAEVEESPFDVIIPGFRIKVPSLIPRTSKLEAAGAVIDVNTGESRELWEQVLQYQD